MELRDITNGISGLVGWSHTEKIKLFAWYLHTYKQRERFVQENIRACYDELHLAKPSNVSPYFSQLCSRKPKEVLHDSKGYYLEKRVRDQFDTKYGQRAATIQVHNLLAELSGKVSNEAERVFLNEAIICVKHKAFRAAIVMAWNLAYSHLEDFILNKHLSTFNARIGVRFPAKLSMTVAVKDDFSECFKESEMIAVAKSAGIITDNVNKILEEKLKRRNMAAHPSTVEITQLQAEDFITDITLNVILKLN